MDNNSLLEVINELVGDTKIYHESDLKTRNRSINNLKLMFSICNNFICKFENELNYYKENGDKEAIKICEESLIKLNNSIDKIVNNECFDINNGENNENV